MRNKTSESPKPPVFRPDPRSTKFPRLCGTRSRRSAAKERSPLTSRDRRVSRPEMARRKMEWAASGTHLRGMPRRAVFVAVGAFAKAVASLLNTTTVHNADTLLRLARHRPPGVPLLTVSNHMSTLDDPAMWGFKGFPSTDATKARWVLAAEDICFKNAVLSYFFRLGKCIPITRGGGIFQEHMNEALERLSDGEWLHTFPEGKVSQEDGPIRRLKWGTASLIDRAPVTPIVLPIVHHGLHEVMPENYFRGRRPPVPLCPEEGNKQKLSRWAYKENTTHSSQCSRSKMLDHIGSTSIDHEERENPPCQHPVPLGAGTSAARPDQYFLIRLGFNYTHAQSQHASTRAIRNERGPGSVRVDGKLSTTTPLLSLYLAISGQGIVRLYEEENERRSVR
ncbi:hypothetical protein NL676_014626 [Syzygium grande]|nr:hypothetical protein NL676_014626 [Syzygium grande]